MARISKVFGKLCSDSGGDGETEVAGSSESHIASSTTTLSVTGIGFTPKAIYFYWWVSQYGGYYGYGFWCSTAAYGKGENSSAQKLYSDTASVCLYDSAGAYNLGTVDNVNSDGFDLTWAKTGSPTQTYLIEIVCIG